MTFDDLDYKQVVDNDKLTIWEKYHYECQWGPERIIYHKESCGWEKNYIDHNGYIRSDYLKNEEIIAINRYIHN